MRSRNRAIVIVAVAAGLTARCGDVNAALGQLAEARRLSADLLVEFTKAADAANRAVMADTDAMSVSDAQEARTARQAVHKDADALGPVLQGLDYSDESRLLQDFAARFAAYETLDDRILDLAVENTNLKAQRLSFGPAQAAADEFRDALDAVAPARDPAQVRALGAIAVAAVREIQALQAPHIAAADDQAMAGLERRMTTAEAAARRALANLAPLVPPASSPRLVAAGKALDDFMAVNAQILALSHRNTNVRSLALSLDEKRKVTGPCEAALRALQAALDKHGYGRGVHPGGR
jgi:methyl-accepting chemotaxis protein